MDTLIQKLVKEVYQEEYNVLFRLFMLWRLSLPLVDY